MDKVFGWVDSATRETRVPRDVSVWSRRPRCGSIAISRSPAWFLERVDAPFAHIGRPTQDAAAAAASVVVRKAKPQRACLFFFVA